MHNHDTMLSASLGSYQERIDSALQEIEDREVIKRIWEHDYTLWKPEPTEITNRLGWLHIADRMNSELPDLEDFVSEIRQAGFKQVLLLGMGGSSLAPEVFRESFGVREGFPDLAVLDSTDPGAIAAQAARLDLAKTLFIVSTKSGGTVETLSFFKYFYNQVDAVHGGENPGSHFIAITDAGSQLDHIASEYKFRHTFHNDPNIGGRYSALSYFGLVPAALIGVDLEQLLERADNMKNHQAAILGTILGELARVGRNKLTLFTSPPISSFGNWVEQLIAESTGKEGKGIVPVVREPVNLARFYGEDRLFVYLQLRGEAFFEEYLEEFESSGHPVVRIRMDDLYDLGEQYLLWELATAVAGALLEINPFNQPDVEAAKILARKMVSKYQEQGELPALESSMDLEGITIYPDPVLDVVSPGSIHEVLDTFLGASKPGAYIALQAYLQPTPGINQALQALRKELRDHTRFATTIGYGPRFLHSTGQLHKGDAGSGMFIQLTSSTSQDIPIPDQPGSQESIISFGVLKQAQALGDRQALLDAGRHVITFDLGADPIYGIRKLAQAAS